MFDAQQFLTDYNIEWYPPGTKNVGHGYIGIKCPYCDDKSTHGGFNLKKEYYSCHRCKGHWMPKIIATLVLKGKGKQISFNDAKEIIKQYTSGKIQTEIQKEKINYADKVILPPKTGPLTKKAKNYIISRNFDPGELVSEWGILSTGNIGYYKFRILAPIYYKGQLVSFQTRYPGKHEKPYLGCKIEESVMNLEHTLYGFDKAVVNKKCLVVEGLFDNWRMGPGAVCTYGIQFTSQQIFLLAKNFDKIFLLYDAEDIAQAQADKIYHALTIGYGKDVEAFTLDSGDPGELSNDDAQHYMKELGL